MQCVQCKKMMSSSETISLGLLATGRLYPACAMEVLPTNHGRQYQVLLVVSHQLHRQGPNPNWMYPCIFCGVIYLT